MLRPIDFQTLDETLPVLARGFPGMGRDRWIAALDRLRRFGASDPSARAAYLLQQNGRDVGVILAIPSTRGTADVVNLSSWYVDPEHRWRAPRMLQSVVACSTTLFTDLTPTTPVRAVIGRLGFRGWTEGTLLFTLPLFAIGRAGSSRVVPLRDLPADAFAGPTRRMLDEHAALDCIVGGLWDGSGLHPLIFSRRTYRGVRVARLIFTDDRAAVFAQIAAIARFLLRERCLLLAVSADRRERIAGSIFTQRPAPAFYKGPNPPAQGDLAYSEFVFLQV